MDILKNKKYLKFDYTSRYSGTAVYYNTVDEKEMTGLSKNVFKDVNYIVHKVKPTDTLDKLALTYYNNPSYWWILAYFNDIQDAFIELYGNYEVLKVPSVSNLTFGDLR